MTGPIPKTPPPIGPSSGAGITPTPTPPPPPPHTGRGAAILGPVTNAYHALIQATAKTAPARAVSRLAARIHERKAPDAPKKNKTEIVRRPTKKDDKSLGPIIAPASTYIGSAFNHFKQPFNLKETLTKYGLIGACLFGLHHLGFDAITANPAMLGAVTLAGNALMMKAYREKTEPDANGKKDPISWTRAAFFQSIFFLSTVVYQALSDNAGLFQYADFTGANALFWDHWLNWDWQAPNMARIAAYWGTYGIMSQVWGDVTSFSLAASNVFHTKICNAVHSVSKKLGPLMPYVNLSLGAVATVFGAYGLCDLWRGTDTSPIHVGETSVNIITTAYALFIGYISLGAVKTPQNLLKFFPQIPAKKVIDEKTGQEVKIPDYVQVPQEVKEFGPDETAAISRGEHNPRFSRTGRMLANTAAGALAGSVLGLGAIGAYELATQSSAMPFVTDNPVLDGTAATAALGLGAVLLAGLKPKGDVRRWIGATRTALVTMFAPARFAYWFGAFTLIGTTVNFGISLISQALQGYEMTSNLVAILAINALFGAAWVNRFVYGTYVAITRKPGSKYAMFIAGYLTLVGAFSAHMKTPQTVSQYYNAAAARFDVTDDEVEKITLRKEMSGLKTLLKGAIDRPATDPETKEKAQAELGRIAITDQRFSFAHSAGTP
ncbi:MAG: hypothetical protein HQM16_01150 [Deltaproteobacteria bacterium]|nr:hypothetical protein [Deltaproteobacteria bacterium]